MMRQYAGFGLPKTSTSERVIPMSDGLYFAFNSTIAMSERVPRRWYSPMLTASLMKRPNLLRRVLHPALAVCGLPKTGWRGFRRSVATTLSEMREPVRTTQQVLGHSPPHTTLAFYTQSVEESESNALSKLERILFPNVPRLEEGPALTH
jgi:integrase